VRDRLHDRRSVGLRPVLTALFAPVHQFGDDVIVKLTGQAGKGRRSLGVRPMAGGAGRDIGFRHAFVVDFFAGAREFSRRAA